MIGGGNLALRGLKSATKDIDIVVLDEIQFSLLQNLLESPQLLPVYVRHLLQT
jgi:ATP:corrinoid adenosyltransferase